MRTFLYRDVGTDKFWNIELTGDAITVQYGRVGSAGKTQTRQFHDEQTARKEHDRAVERKLGEGYVETTPAPAEERPAPSPLQQALEATLEENPGDVASHM